MNFIEKHPLIMIILGICGISVSGILVRFSAAPSTVTAAYRLLWTVILMLPAVVANREVSAEIMHADKKTVMLCVGSGIALAVHFAVWFESLKFTSVASSTTIVCTEVIWVALGFCIFMGGRVPIKAVAAILITMIGSVIIAMADSTLGSTNFFGDVLALIAAIAVAIYTLIGRVARKTMSTTAYTFIVYVACAVALVVSTYAGGESLFGWGGKSLIVGFLLALCSTILGHSIFSWCLKYFSPAFVSASKLCEPVVAALIAIPLFGEVPGMLMIIGGVLIIGGVIWYSRIEIAENKS